MMGRPFSKEPIMPFIVLILCIMLAFVVVFLLTDEVCCLFGILSFLFFLGMLSYAIQGII